MLSIALAKITSYRTPTGSSVSDQKKYQAMSIEFKLKRTTANIII